MNITTVFWIIALVVLGWIGSAIYSKGVGTGVATESKKTVAVQVSFDEYKTSIANQLSKAKAEALALKLEQEKKYAKSQADYRHDTTLLAERLRDFGGVLCGEEQIALRVDGSGSNPLPTETRNPSGTSKAPQAPAIAGQGVSLADALSDTLQCSRLIDFVK